MLSGVPARRRITGQTGTSAAQGIKSVTLSGQAVSQWGFLVEYGLVVGMLCFNQDR